MLSRLINKIKFTQNLMSLGSGFFSKLKILLVIFWISLRDKLRISSEDVRFDLVVNDKEINLIFSGTHAELLMIEEIFFHREYDMNIVNPKNILDLGSNIGLSTIFFATKYPEAKIISIEPDPETFKILEKNTKQFSNVILLNCAVSDKNGSVDFFKNKKHNASSIFHRNAEDQKITVNTVSLVDVFSKNNLSEIDILKFDIEGAEFKVFENWNEWQKVKSITGEIHADLAENESFDLLRLLKDKFSLSVESGGKRGRAIVKGVQNV